jgi:hypothetical protein
MKKGASIRTALRDVILNDEYLLIQTPTGVLQADLKTWGPDAKVFNPYRFITQESFPNEGRKPQAQAFIPFSRGKNLCLGRHLAFTEIAAFFAMIFHGFEMTANDGGNIQVPEEGFQNLGVASISPKKDPSVLSKRRDEFDSTVWGFDVGYRRWILKSCVTASPHICFKKLPVVFFFFFLVTFQPITYGTESFFPRVYPLKNI